MFSSFSRPASATKIFSSSSNPLDDILGRDDLNEILNAADNSGQRAVMTFVERNLPKLLSAASLRVPSSPMEVVPISPVSSSTSSSSSSAIASRKVANAATLLIKFVQLHPSQPDALRRVVPSTISFLAKKGCLSAANATALNRILLAAFDEDFSGTSYGINIALGDEVVHGAIRNLAINVTVGETLIAMFGSALPAATMMLPSTTPNIFTDLWIKHNFPFHVAIYIKVAMSNVDCLPYFTFMQELLKRGLSHSAGPIVDRMLEHDTFEVLLTSIIDSIVANQTNLVASLQQQATRPDGSALNFADDGLQAMSSQQYPLVSEGLLLMSNVVSLIRRIIPPTESVAQYHATPSASAPLGILLQHLPQLLDVVLDETILASSQCPAAQRPRRVGMCRMALLEIIYELVATQLHGIDEVLVGTRAIPRMVMLWARHPDSDSIARLVERCLVAIFSRKLFAPKSLTSALTPHSPATEGTGDVLFDALYDRGDQRSTSDGEMMSDDVLGCVRAWCCSAKTVSQQNSSSLVSCAPPSPSSLAPWSLSIAMQLHELPWFCQPGVARDGFFTEVLQLNCAGRVMIWMSPITGSQFQDPGSGCPGFSAIHRPPSNPMNVSVVSTVSDQTVDEDERLTAARSRGGVTPSDPLANSNGPATASGSASRAARYSSVTFDENDEADDGPRANQEFRGFVYEDDNDDVPAGLDSTDDDAVLCGDDDLEAIEHLRRDSIDRADDEAWVEQAIMDVTVAVADSDR